MSQQEFNAFYERVSDERIDKLEDDPTLNDAHAENMVLDDLGLPRYPECSKEGQ